MTADNGEGYGIVGFAWELPARLNSGCISTRGEDASGFDLSVLRRGYLATAVFGNVGVGGAAKNKCGG